MDEKPDTAWVFNKDGWITQASNYDNTTINDTNNIPNLDVYVVDTPEHAQQIQPKLLDNVSHGPPGSSFTEIPGAVPRCGRILVAFGILLTNKADVADAKAFVAENSSRAQDALAKAYGPC